MNVRPRLSIVYPLVCGTLIGLGSSGAAQSTSVPADGPTEAPPSDVSATEATSDTNSTTTADGSPPADAQGQNGRRRRQAPFPTSLSSGMGMGMGAGALGGGGFGGTQASGAGIYGGPAIFSPRVNYSAVWYPSQPVRGQDSGLAMERQDFGLSMPVWGDGANRLSVSTNVRSLLTETQAILPTTGRAFPTTLWSLGLGVTYMHMFQNGWTLTTLGNIGSSSDHPFDRNDLNVSVGGFVRIPSGERNAWTFGAMYSPTSELPFPMPIASYFWQVNDQFSMNLGLPFSMRWRPYEDWQFDFSYTPVRNVHSRITYRLAEGLGLYTGFDWANESYFLADRTDVAERLFYYEKRITTGVRYNISPKAAVDFSGGYAFDRIFFTGKQWSDQNHDRIDVGNTLFLAIRFQARY